MFYSHHSVLMPNDCNSEPVPSGIKASQTWQYDFKSLTLKRYTNTFDFYLLASQVQAISWREIKEMMLILRDLTFISFNLCVIWLKAVLTFWPQHELEWTLQHVVLLQFLKEIFKAVWRDSAHHNISVNNYNTVFQQKPHIKKVLYKEKKMLIEKLW